MFCASTPPVEEVKKSAVQFTTIEVTEEEVLNPPPSDTELDRKNISTETVEGEEGFITPTDVVTPTSLTGNVAGLNLFVDPENGSARHYQE